MIGVTEEHFWDSTPNELEPYRIMDQMSQERRDYEMWVMGHYVMSAVQTAVSAVLAGKKSKAKYVEEPLTQMAKAEEVSENKASDFDRFCAWAMVFNEHYEKSKGQGE